MRFLVADDDPALGMFLTRGLEADGHIVTLANNGQAAVDAFLRETPDYVTGLVSSLDQVTQSEQTLTGQLSSGVKVNSLSDNPAAAGETLIADFTSGAPSATSVADLASLSSALGYVDQQRAVIDNSINRLTASSNYASSESVQLQSAQDTLIQTDTAQAATQLNVAETQQAALTQVIAALEKQETLFQAL
jgi:CheY-like chemotaxis protein